MQTQADKFLDILTILGTDGYYARTAREKEIMSSLEKKHLIYKKPGTKKVYLLNSVCKSSENLNKQSFKELLTKEFKKAQTAMRPFVPINEIRETMVNFGVQPELFNSYLIELYDNNELELEKSFTADEGLKSGLNYKNKKFFSYITQID